jgi:hypothetical protein
MILRHILAYLSHSKLALSSEISNGVLMFWRQVSLDGMKLAESSMKAGVFWGNWLGLQANCG